MEQVNKEIFKVMHEAKLWKEGKEGHVVCNLCCHRCNIGHGKTGICGVRRNVDGKLYSLNYAKLISRTQDPIEKKPLFHFKPGTDAYSIATVGCNFKCKHCQNYQISQVPKDYSELEGEHFTPDEVVAEARNNSCNSIAYTYTEPTIFYEYAMDCAELAKKAGLKNIFVTNGFMTKECLDDMDGLLDAANVDLKSFSEDFYKNVCGGRLAPVLETIEHMRSLGIWVEVTTLIIPGYNDSEEELTNIARWLAKTDKKMPWHISAFFPTYKLTDAPRTPPETITRACEIGRAEGLYYVYGGNVPGNPNESTYCYKCKELIIERFGFNVMKNDVRFGKCPHCDAEIHGVEL